MNKSTIAEAIAWFEKRKAGAAMPGANAMYDKAIAALHTQQEKEKNDPLTLDELREMDGEPVWIETMPQKNKSFWAIVNGKYGVCRNAVDALEVFKAYRKTWLAYRRKPEEEME